jgi:hypothetical protein
MDYQVTAITTTPHGSFNSEHITKLWTGSTPWDVSTVIFAIKEQRAGRGDIRFYTLDHLGGKAWVTVVSPTLLREYVRSVADNRLTDNLLSLPRLA